MTGETAKTRARLNQTLLNNCLIPGNAPLVFTRKEKLFYRVQAKNIASHCRKR